MIDCTNNQETLVKIFSSMNDWPSTWAGNDKDIPIGESILKYFKEFLKHQQSCVSKKTLKDYGHYLWLLGGEIIRETSGTRIKAKDISEKFMNKYISKEGGTFCRHLDSEKEFNRYNYVCSLLFKHINETMEND